MTITSLICAVLQTLLVWSGPAVSQVHAATGQDQGRETSPPFLGNFLIEDSCQFQLCGPAFSSEWGTGEPPVAGSCSGDCSLLAATLNNNKFHKEFLWPNCARMCGARHPTSRAEPEYKRRFLCMESCYSAYNLVAPHHNIARYCIQAACRALPPNSTQIDCFGSCSEHVATSLPETTWRLWAKSLAGECSPSFKHLQSIKERLKCADDGVWRHASEVEHNIEKSLATHCLDSLCGGQVKCGVACIKHVHQLERDQRTDWSECSSSDDCQVDTEWHARKECADTCLLHTQQRREEEERLSRVRTESRAQLQLQYSSRASSRCLANLFAPLLGVAVISQLLKRAEWAL